MTRLEALEALAEKVAAGEWDQPVAWEVFGIGENVSAVFAFKGSLDAAISLHETVLAGWEWRMSSRGAAAVWTTPSTLQQAEIEDEPARALLLAILKALISRAVNRLSDEAKALDEARIAAEEYAMEQEDGTEQRR